MIPKMARALMLLVSNPRLFAWKVRRHMRCYGSRLRGSSIVTYVERGVKFECDLTIEYAEMGYWHQYQPELVERIRDLLRPGDVFIDVGANIGYVSFVAAQHVGRTGQIHSFEPLPECYAKLERFRELNPVFDIRVNNVALGEAEGCATIYVPSHDIGASTMVEGRIEKPADEHMVHVTRLDKYIQAAGIGAIRLIKIDTEGYEYEVLKGMGSLLERRGRARPAIICEIIPGLLRSAGTSTQQMSEFMQRLGYRSFWLSKMKGSVNVSDIKRQTDVIFVPEEWSLSN